MTLSNVKSLGTPSKEVFSTHYHGSSYPGLPGELIKSIGNKALSEQYPAIPFTWKNPTAQTWDGLMAHTDNTPYPVKDKDGNLHYVHKTILKEFTAPAIDRRLGSNYNPEFLFNPYKKNDRMDGWMNPPIHETISTGKLPEFTGFTVAHHERPARSLADPIFGKYVTDIYSYSGPNNEFGIHLSQAETLKQDWKRYLNSREGKGLARRRGIPEDIGYLEVIPTEGVIYAIGRLNEKVRLATGTNAYKYLSEMADRYGVSLEDMIFEGLEEEARHNIRGSYDKRIYSERGFVREERETKEEQLHDKRRSMEESGSNEKLRKIYGKLVKAKEEDVRTVERYRGRGKTKQPK